MATCLMNTLDIQKILPHRYPFLLVDYIAEFEVNVRIVGIKNVTINEPFFQGHFPGRPIMPGVLILEALAQVGGVLAIKSLPLDGAPVVYLAGLDHVKFRKPVVPGDQLRLHVEVMKRRPPFWRMLGKAFVEDSVVAEGETTAMVSVEQSERTGPAGPESDRVDIATVEKGPA
ncbi:MAG: 3-hydroxyacyl-[acyl-carrier-protein] dehydratase FabZ [Nitrospirae bacterium]|nr:MAG: 3-hydroxyacyl-[acyl-carrier-protein] dehydratase FabZ [Nitrospirota bacterium]